MALPVDELIAGVGPQDRGEMFLLPSYEFDREVVELSEAVFAASGEEVSLGEVSILTDEEIPSSYQEFRVFRDRPVEYPPEVLESIGELVGEYHEVFSKHVRPGIEHPTDYQHLRLDAVGGGVQEYFSPFIQVDMRGIPERALPMLAAADPDVRKEVIRKIVFEFENSLGMYNQFRLVHTTSQRESYFKRAFDAALEDIRERTGKPIAVLATTQQKYQDILQTELGVDDITALDDDEIRRRIGFDMVLGPEEFRRAVAENDGESPYILFARTSLRRDELKKPRSERNTASLLDEPEMVRIVRESAITLSVDNPAADRQQVPALSDTKRALPDMGMGFLVDRLSDMQTPEFMDWMHEHGLDQDTRVRAKPVEDHYGGYGTIEHRYKPLTVEALGRSGSKLERAINERGPYLLQPELSATTAINEDEVTDTGEGTESGKGEGTEYPYMDRMFFYTTPDGTVMAMGGVRTFMRTVNDAGERVREVQKNVIHGTKDAILAELMPAGEAVVLANVRI